MLTSSSSKHDGMLEEEDGLPAPVERSIKLVSNQNVKITTYVKMAVGFSYYFKKFKLLKSFVRDA